MSLINETEDIGGSVVPREVTEEDEVSDQHSYCFNVEDDPKAFDEAIKLQIDLQKKTQVAHISTIRLLIAMASIHNLIIYQMDVKTTFLNGELDEDVYMNQPQGFIMLGNENKEWLVIYLTKLTNEVYDKFDESGKGVITCLYVDDMLIFDTDQVQVDMTNEFLSSKFSMKDMEEANIILALASTQFMRVLAVFEKNMDLLFEHILVSSFSMLERYIDASWISNTEDNSSTSGWVFMLGGGAISWASKKQTCITGSTMKSKFVALATAGKEAEWLRNLILEIPLWSKPIAPRSILCDSAATLAKAYRQMYNGKSRHLGVRHSMIRELITNGVVFIDFLRSQRNLAGHLTKRLARDLVLKSTEGMG
ncbi:zinc finger, CCHC-type containing protein [Tanacetum coccineum]